MNPRNKIKINQSLSDRVRCKPFWDYAQLFLSAWKFKDAIVRSHVKGKCIETGIVDKRKI